MLFADLSDDGVYADVANVLTFITSYFAQFGVENPVVDAQAIDSVVRGMRQNFPHAAGMDQASPFKKAANFACWFVAQKPIGTQLPIDFLSGELSHSKYTNAVLALSIAIEALHGATLKWRCDGSEHVLENEIKLSKHSFVDIVEALAEGSPLTNFKLVSVLLEQMAYKTNPDCQYPDWETG